MAELKIDTGFTRITNEFLDALIKIRVPGEAMQVLLAIIRKTYGFNKTEDWISLSQFKELIGQKKQTVFSSSGRLRPDFVNMSVESTDLRLLLASPCEASVLTCL
jgi:phage replication O-like protein O